MADFLGMGVSNQQTREQIPSESSIQPLYKVKNENLLIEEGPTKASKYNIGHSWIVGSSTNGIVGDNTATQDGQQQVVGSAGKVESIQFVSNPNRQFAERFNFTDFKNAANTTATWAANSLSFTGVQTARSNSVAYNDGTITVATIGLDSDADTSKLALKLSANGGTNFESVTADVEHIFTNTGTDLRWQLVSNDTVTVKSIIINYG